MAAQSERTEDLPDGFEQACANLTEKQTDAVKDVIKRTKELEVWRPEHNDPVFFMKWMVAREWDAKNTINMLIQDYMWRKAMRADTILSEPKEEVCKVAADFFPGNFEWVDKQSRPVFILPYGRVDLPGLIHSTTRFDWDRFLCRMLEDVYARLNELTQKSGKKVSRLVGIFDMEHFGMHQVTYKPGARSFVESLMVMEDHYPELLEVAYVVNVPTIFSIAWAIICPFLTKLMKEKIKVLSGNNWKETLLENIDREQLPVRYGGILTGPDGDPDCKHKINYSGPIDKKTYYVPGIPRAEKEQMQEVAIKKGSQHSIELQIDNAGSTIKWQFFTKNHDIAYGIHHQVAPDESASAEHQKQTAERHRVVRIKKCFSHLVPESGSYQCEWPGKYDFIFDNSYSVITSKTVYYKIWTL